MFPLENDYNNIMELTQQNGINNKITPFVIFSCILFIPNLMLLADLLYWATGFGSVLFYNISRIGYHYQGFFWSICVFSLFWGLIGMYRGSKTNSLLLRRISRLLVLLIVIIIMVTVLNAVGFINNF